LWLWEKCRDAIASGVDEVRPVKAREASLEMVKEKTNETLYPPMKGRGRGIKAAVVVKKERRWW
jgi:hypothetical protein